MKRIVDQYLIDWKDSPYRKPLLLRGARQVGKTYAVRQFGKTFENFVEINFESDENARNVFNGDLDPERIIRDLSIIIRRPIVPGQTLIFFDEIQGVPKALTALRYFYEKLPVQHIIAAGSLLDFTTQEIGIPVGRVTSLYMYPLSFFEFLCACGYSLAAKEILKASADNPMTEVIHQMLIKLLGEYLAIGGMPEAVLNWKTTKDPLLCLEIHRSLIDTYRQDFGKYAQKFQIKYIETLFDSIPLQLGKKFKYSAIPGDYRKRELLPCFDLLNTAGVIQPVLRSYGNGIPLGAEADPNDFKVIFLDVGLSQTILGLDLKSWFLDPEREFVNKGELVEAFVGQEFLAYSHPTQKSNLFYWRRKAPGSEAEVDYLIQDKAQVIPIEVKSAMGTTLKSMHMFLESHPKSPYGIRISAHNYSILDTIKSYPLYAIVKIMLQNWKEDIRYYEALL